MKLSILLKLFFWAALVFSLNACAAPSVYTDMMPISYDISNKINESVAIIVNGGSDDDISISNITLKKALVESIIKSRLFKGVVLGGGADYQLEVSILSLEQPPAGLTFTVKVEAGWMLRRFDNSKIIWQEAILSEHTATVSDAFAGRMRLQLAREGAVRENIYKGLNKISKLNLR